MAKFLQFLHMGGYGFFVWGSYGVVAAVLIQQYVAPLRRRKKLLAELELELELSVAGKSAHRREREPVKPAASGGADSDGTAAS